MNSTANNKLLALLTKLLDAYLSHIKHVNKLSFNYDYLAKDIDVNTVLLEVLLHNFESREIINGFADEVLSPDEGPLYYIILFPRDFVSKANNFIDELSQAETPPQLNGLEFIKRKGQLFIKFNTKKIRLSDDVDSMQSKLVLILSKPSLGTFKSIDEVVQRMSSSNIKKYSENKDRIILIKEVFREIGRKLAGDKFPIKLKLKWTPNEGAVALLIKSGNEKS